MTPRRGFMLVAALLLLSVMLVMGMGLLGSRASRNEAQHLATQAARARALAWAGMEATRMKLAKDLNFPPQAQGGDHEQFSFTETVYDLDQTFVGTYTTTIETQWRQSPYLVYRITTLGKLGPAQSPQARYKLVGELDVSEQDRTNPALANPTYFRWVVWSDEGVY